MRTKAVDGKHVHKEIKTVYQEAMTWADGIDADADPMMPPDFMSESSGEHLVRFGPLPGTLVSVKTPFEPYHRTTEMTEVHRGTIYCHCVYWRRQVEVAISLVSSESRSNDFETPMETEHKD